MNTSELGRLNGRDFILGLAVAVGTAIFAAIADALEMGPLANLDWPTIVSIGIAAALGYMMKNLASDDEGRLLGSV